MQCLFIFTSRKIFTRYRNLKYKGKHEHTNEIMENVLRLSIENIKLYDIDIYSEYTVVQCMVDVLISFTQFMYGVCL